MQSAGIAERESGRLDRLYSIGGSAIQPDGSAWLDLTLAAATILPFHRR